MSREDRKQYVAHKALLVNKHGKVLILKSSAPDGDGNVWDFPGGQMEKGEEPLFALQREVEEEIGIRIDVDQAELFHVMKTQGFGSMAHESIIKLFYVIRFEETELNLSWEHDGSLWLDPRNPIPKDMQGFVRDVLMRYRKHAHVQEVDQRILGHKGFGLVQLIHGHGKGKTTSALGLAVRAAGAGKRVAIVYFDKGGTDHCSERAVIDTIDKIDYFPTGRDRIDPETGRFDFSITDVDRTEANRGISIAETASKSGEYDLVILDEINSTVDLGMTSVESVLKIIQDKSPNVELVLTGRDPHPKFLEAAHLVSEVQLQKHYFYSGITAREGIDF